MKLAFIGIGNVGFAIANNLQKLGHNIIIANNDDSSESVKNALYNNPNFEVKKTQDAVNLCDIVFLAIPFQANQEVLKDIQFNGKTLIDCTNPVGPGISHGLKSERAGSEYVQEIANDAKVVKAFSIYGYENFQNPNFPNYQVKPAMLICGNDEYAKKQASSLINELGFEAKDTGDLSQALHLEHMTLLWVKMVRKNGHHPNFTWAYLEK